MARSFVNYSAPGMVLPQSRGRPFPAVVPGILFGLIVTGIAYALSGRTLATGVWMYWLLGLLVFYAFRNIEAALCVFAFAVPFEFIFYGWGVGRFNMLAYPAIVLCAVVLQRSPRSRAVLNLPEWVFLALLAWCVMTLFWAEDRWRGLGVIFTHFGTFAVLYLFSRGISNYETILKCLWYFLGGTVLLILLIATYYERSTWVTYYGKQYLSALFADEVSNYEVGSAALVGFIAALALWEFERTRWRQRIGLLCAGILAVSVLLTLGRTLALELAACALVWSILSGGSRARLGKVTVAVLLLCSAVIAASVINPGAFEVRWTTTRELAEQENLRHLSSGRTLIWETAVPMFLDHPVSGIGMGQFLAVYTQITGIPKGTHSVYLGFLVETGLIGFSLLVALYLVLGGRVWRIRPWRHVTVAWWVYLLIESGFHGYHRSKTYWIMAGLTVALTRALDAQVTPSPNPGPVAGRLKPKVYPWQRNRS